MHTIYGIFFTRDQHMLCCLAFLIRREIRHNLSIIQTSSGQYSKHLLYEIDLNIFTSLEITRQGYGFALSWFHIQI